MNINALTIHPENPEIVYIGEMNSGIYKTIDGGDSWTHVSVGLRAKDIRSLAIDPQNPDIIYAGTELGGLWKSEDSGDSWKNASGGMPPEATIHSIAIDPTNTKIIYAADMHTGVHRSVDSGVIWQQINNGLEVLSIHDLVISDDGQTLYAATDGNGVYRLDINGKAPDALPEIAEWEAEGTYYSVGSTSVSTFTDNFSGFQIDGSGADWIAQTAIASDPVGDGVDGFLDLTSVYTLANEEALLFLIEFANIKGKFIQIDIAFTSGPKSYNCSVRPSESTAWCGDVTESGWEEVGPTQYSHFAIGEAIEGRIDLREFGGTEVPQLDEINVMVGGCCGVIWMSADRWTTKGTDHVGSGDTSDSFEDELSGLAIDGSGEDWADRAVLQNDPAGDAEEGFLDLTSGYAFINDEALLFLVEFADPQAPYVHFDIVFETGSNEYLCSADPGSSQAYCGDITSGGWQDMGPTEYSHFAIGEALEGRFDLREFGATEGYQLKEINVMVGECCNYPEWRAADTMSFREPIPEE